jgi:hypothetical protein
MQGDPRSAEPRARDGLGTRLDQLVRDWALVWRQTFIGYRRPHPADRRRQPRVADEVWRARVIDRRV